MGSSPHLWFWACKTASLAHELLVSIGPSPLLRFLHANQWLSDQNYKSLWVPDLTCPFEHAKHRDLRQNIKYIWVPALICGFVHAKRRPLNPSSKSLWVPDITCRFVHAIQRDEHQNYCVYGSQPLSVVYTLKTATFGAELQVYMGPRHDVLFCACKTAWLPSESLVSLCPSPHL